MNQIAEEVRRYLNEEKFFFVAPQKIVTTLEERMGKEVRREYEEYYSGHSPKFLSTVRDHYNAFGKASEIISGVFRRERESFLQKMYEMIGGMRCERVIDGGCGTGLDICFLAGKLPNVDFIGYDVSAGNCKIAVERAKRRNLKNVNLLPAITENMPFAPKSSDVIYFNDSFLEDGVLGLDENYNFAIYPETEEKAIKRIKDSKRVLKNQGVLVFSMMPETKLSEDMFLCYFEGMGFKLEQKSPFDWVGGRLYFLRKS